MLPVRICFWVEKPPLSKSAMETIREDLRRRMRELATEGPRRVMLQPRRAQVFTDHRIDYLA